VCTREVDMCRAVLPFFNPANNGRAIEIFDPYLVEEVFRHEGKYPSRGPGLAAFKLIRKRRPGDKSSIKT